MIGYLLLGVLSYAFYWYNFIFMEKKNNLLKLFKQVESITGNNIMYLCNTNNYYFLYDNLKSHLVSIDDEDRILKNLHKLKGNLLLIINFKQSDQQKLIPLIKSLTAYSKLQGNSITTYVPYKAKDNSSMIALSGKSLILGNYATLTNIKPDNLLEKILEHNYGNSIAKKIISNFFISDAHTETCYTADELCNLKIASSIEEKANEKFKESIRQLMEEVNSFIK